MRIRVGLATDLPRWTAPCCQGSPVAVLGERRLPLDKPLVVEPAAAGVEPSTFRLQVAALKDEQQAQALARRLETLLGPPADARFDAATDLYRVRTGSYPDRAGAERALGTLSTQGIRGGWVVSEGGGLKEPALKVVHGGRATLVRGRWLALEPGPGHVGVTAGDLPDLPGRRSYRGRLLVYLNDRGRLNLINDLSLEDYLKGVVPQEMGPALYDQLDAIKAQAVAARTYTLRHLGEFAADGYDICATPRCQVYGGLAAEHPLSSRAVEETAGQVMVFRPHPEAPRGLIDARYTATCGGHTEDVGEIFPLVTDEPYLAGVPCVEAGGSRLAGNLAPGIPLEQGLVRRLLPPGSADARADLESRLLELARTAQLPLPDDRLASLERREVRRYLASIFDLALDPRIFLAPTNDLDTRARRHAREIAAAGVLEGDPEAKLGSAAEREKLLFHLSRALGVLRREKVSFLALNADGGFRVRLPGAAAQDFEEVALPADLATFRGEPPMSTPELWPMAGDPLVLFRTGDSLLGVLQLADPVAGSAAGLARHPGSQRSPWRRFRSRETLAAEVELRYPGFGFRDFEVLGHGTSGRVTKVRLLGRAAPVEVEGLAIRWIFDLPELWLSAEAGVSSSGSPGWWFRGRGWGHGVGLCQVGAFGMARRGIGYEEILAHFYSGATLARLSRPTT